MPTVRRWRFSCVATPKATPCSSAFPTTAPGVADNELTRLRERFYRSPTVQPLSGSGLGLAIVERIAELHGATLRLINRPEGGFEAALRWPSEGR